MKRNYPHNKNNINTVMQNAMLDAIAEWRKNKKTNVTLTYKPSHYTLIVRQKTGRILSQQNKTWKKPRITLGGKEWKYQP